MSIKSINCIWVIMFIFSGMHADAASPKGQEVEPDYTKGENPEGENHTPWALGSTGAFGNIWHGDQRMIQIHSIATGSPADGKLKVLDVILGVDSPKVGATASVKFDSEARKVLSAAITEAEKKGGKLVLNIWRPETVSSTKLEGKNQIPKTSLKQPISAQMLKVTLTLPLKGSFSATSPWNCKKTEVLINDAAKAIGKGGLKGGIPGDLNALGLLATGDQKYLPFVRDYVRERAKQCEGLDVMGDKGIGTWQAGYQNILMTEYYLLTKDEQVLPGIKALSTYVAYGQSGVGTWSHGMANVRQNGLYGPSASYGSMNSASIPCAISLVLAQKCGVTTSPVNDAVNRSRSFYHYYVDKGSIPYGENPPGPSHDDNGKNSMAAVFFDLLGDKEATKYFATMTLASYNEREGGHTGHWFAWQWGALGASRGGPAAAQAFVQSTQWFTELERRADGSSVYQPQLKGDHNKYGGWATTGQRLMQHCLPRKVLYITGKVDSCVTPFKDAEVKEAMAAGTFNPKELSVKELLAALGNWSRVVRQSAAVELGQRNDDVVEPLIAMLNSNNRFARYGACAALRTSGRNSDKAVTALIDKIENDQDMSLRYFAVNALHLPRSGKGPNLSNALGGAAKNATPALLKISTLRDPNQDSMGMLSGTIAEMLLYQGNAQPYVGFFPDGGGTENLDRKLLIPAMKAWLTNPNGRARTMASSVYDNLSEKDLESLWGEIYYAAKYQAPANAMFAGGGRAKGFDLMSNLGIEEGITVGIELTLRQDGWGHGGREAQRPTLLKYGKALESYVPEIETILVGWEKGQSFKNKPVGAKAFRQELADALAKPAPQLKSIKPFLNASSIKEPVKVFPSTKQ